MLILTILIDTNLAIDNMIKGNYNLNFYRIKPIDLVMQNKFEQKLFSISIKIVNNLFNILIYFFIFEWKFVFLQIKNQCKAMDIFQNLIIRY